MTDQDNPSPLWRIPLICPVCRAIIHWRGSRGYCHCSTQNFRLVKGCIADLLGGDTAEANSLQRWPASFVDRLLGWIPISNKPPVEVRDELSAAGLIDEVGDWTSLGQTVVYHLTEYHLQGDPAQYLPSALLKTLNQDSQVLDVGCGAGQTLHRLGQLPAGRVGLDTDLIALTLGSLVGEKDPAPVQWVRASGDKLPFADGQFSHVLCRVAINYMHQGHALRELTRVLRKGGYLYLHAEGPWFDVRLLRTAQGTRARLCRLRDIVLGLQLALTDWQPLPGGRFTGGRIFATPARFRRLLRNLGCVQIGCQLVPGWGPLPVGFRLLVQRIGDQI